MCRGGKSTQQKKTRLLKQHLVVVYNEQKRANGNVFVSIAPQWPHFPTFDPIELLFFNVMLCGHFTPYCVVVKCLPR